VRRVPLATRNIPGLHWLVSPRLSERKGGSVYKRQPDRCPEKGNESYIGNSTDYSVESLEWLEVCRADGVYLRDGSVNPTDNPDRILCNRGHKSC